MAIQFKRISPFPPPTPEQDAAISRLMIEYLMTHRDEWDDLLEEPDEPLPPEPQTEFVDHQCPECQGWRLGYVPRLDIRMAATPDGLPKSGHYLTCSRWKKHWPAGKDTTDK